jgi:hypothetical protein
MCLDKERQYELILEEHRYTSDFRVKIIGGLFAIYAALGLAFSWFQKEATSFSWIVPLFGAFITILFYLADKRNKQALDSSREIGENIENDENDPFPLKRKYFSSLSKGPSHAKLIQLFSIVSSILLFIISIILIIFNCDLYCCLR